MLIPSSLKWAQKIFWEKVRKKIMRSLCFSDFALLPLFFAYTCSVHFFRGLMDIRYLPEALMDERYLAEICLRIWCVYCTVPEGLMCV